MPRFRLTDIHTILVASALAFAPSLASAQDDAEKAAEKAATEAEKQRGEIQKKLAGGTELQKRLRLDKFEAVKDTVHVTGVFLDAPPAKADDPVPFEQVTDELFKSLRDQLKHPTLKFDSKGITRVPPDQHPHVVLQLAANAAGARGETAADECKFDSSRFNATGGLVIVGTRGKTDAVGNWIAGAIPTTLGKHPAVRVKDDKPDVTADVTPVEWKLSTGTIQKLLAASGKPDGTPEEKNKYALRRLWVERAFFTYQIAKPEGKEATVSLRFRIEGVRMGEAEVKVEWAEDTINPIVADAAGKPVPADYGTLVSVVLEEPVKSLRTAVADHPAIKGDYVLDGVRIDPGTTFGPEGELILAGVQPGLTPADQKDLEKLVQSGFEAYGKGKPLAAKYAKVAKQPVLVKAMTILPLGKVKADLRNWAIRTKDDLKFLRLYFPDNIESLKKRYYVDEGGLVLLYRPSNLADIKDVEAEFKRALKTHLEGGIPQPTGAAPPVASHTDAAEKEPLLPSLTAYLRKEMAGDQKKWNGVLIERGYFDLANKNKYTILGVVDTPQQNTELQNLLESLKADPKWVEYFTPEEPTKVALDVIPMHEMLDRVKRVTPAYPVFDGIRIESARYDANVNLIFDAHIVGELDRDAAPRLAELLKNSTYKRRVAAGKQVLIVRHDGPAYSDDQVANFSLGYGAKLLAKAPASKEDRQKAKEWLDVAMLHYPNEAAVWFLSAYYNYTNTAEDKDSRMELVRRDLYRTIDLEGPLAFNGPAQRKRRYDTAKDLQGPIRNELEALWLDYFREVKDGAKPMTMTKK